MGWYQYQENMLIEEKRLITLDKWRILSMEDSTGIGMEVNTSSFLLQCHFSARSWRTNRELLEIGSCSSSAVYDSIVSTSAVFLFALVVGGILMLGIFSLCVVYFFGGACRKGKPPPDVWRLCCQKWKTALPLIPPAVQASFLFLVVVLFCFVCLFIFHIFCFSYWNFSFPYFWALAPASWGSLIYVFLVYILFCKCGIARVKALVPCLPK